MAEKLKIIYGGIIPGVIPAVMALVPANGRTSVTQLETPTKAVVITKNNKALVAEYRWTLAKSVSKADLALMEKWDEEKEPVTYIPDSSPPEWIKIDSESRKIRSWTVDEDGAWKSASSSFPREPPSVTTGAVNILRFVSPTKALLIGGVEDTNIRHLVIINPGSYNESGHGSTASGAYPATLSKVSGVWQLQWHGRGDYRRWASWYTPYRPENSLIRKETLILGMNGSAIIDGVDQWHPIIWTCQGGDSWVRFVPIRSDHGQDVAFSDHLATVLTMTTTQFGDDNGLSQTKFYNTLTGDLLRASEEVVGRGDGSFKEQGSDVSCFILRVVFGRSYSDGVYNPGVGDYMWTLETPGGTQSGLFGVTVDLNYDGWGAESINTYVYGRSAKQPDFRGIEFTVRPHGRNNDIIIPKVVASSGVVLPPAPEGKDYFMKQDGEVATIPEGYSKGVPDKDVAIGWTHAYFVAAAKEITFPSSREEMLSLPDSLAVIGVSMTDKAQVIRVSDGKAIISVEGAGARAAVSRDGTRAIAIAGNGLARIFDLTKPANTRATSASDSGEVADRLAAERLMPLITDRAKLDISKLPVVDMDVPLPSLAVVALQKSEKEPAARLVYDLDASGRFTPAHKEGPIGKVTAFATTPDGKTDRLFFPGKTLRMLITPPAEATITPAPPAP